MWCKGPRRHRRGPFVLRILPISMWLDDSSWEQRMLFCLHRVSMTLSLALVAGCGLSSDDRNSSSSTQDPWEYEYSVNGCTTGKVRGEGREAHCQALQNDALNNHCAREMRGLMLKNLCAAQGQADVRNSASNLTQRISSRHQPQGRRACLPRACFEGRPHCAQTGYTSRLQLRWSCG